MGRIGITYYDVAQAATTIMQQGQQPTIDRIREHLGTGSKTTISTHLKQWKYDNKGDIALTRTSLPPDLLALVQGLWDGMKQTTQNDIDALNTQHQQEKQQLCQTLEKEQQALELNNKDIESLQEVRKKLTDQCTAFEALIVNKDQTLQQLKDALAIASAKLQEKQQQVKAQQRQIEHAFTNLEHFRASIQEQRQQEQLQADQQRQELQSHIKALYTDLHQAKADVVNVQAHQQVLEHKNHFLVEEKQHLEKKLAQDTLQYQQTTEQYNSLRSHEVALQAKNEFFENRVLKLDTDLVQKQQTIVELQWRLEQSKLKERVMED